MGRLLIICLLLFCGAISAAEGEDEQNSLSFNVVAWSPKRGKYDLDRAARILRDADVSLMGNVEFDAQGKPPLLIVANLVERQTSEHICQVWFRGTGQRHEPYAIAWRDSQFAFIDESGVLHEHCGNHPWTLTVGASATARAQLMHRPTSRILNFKLAATPSAPGRASNAIAGVFQSDSPSEWASLIFADLKIPASHKSFAGVKARSFRAALPKSLHANLWSRKLGLVEVNELHWRTLFPEISAKYAHDHLGDQAPLRATFSTTEGEATQARAELIRKKKRGSKGTKKEAPAAPVGQAYPGPVNKKKLVDADDDLLGEARAAGGEKARPQARKKRKPVSH